MATGKRIVDAGKLTAFAADILQKMGVPEHDAKITARKLVATDLRGIESHGVAHLASLYVHHIKEGLVNPKPNIKVLGQTPATAVVDGDRGLGFVVGDLAMNEAMNRAETAGAGFVAVRNSTHYGAGSIYAIMALSRGMIGISMTTGGVGMLVPGSVGRGAGINVISLAAPTKEESPFVFDMASTVVAAGKLEIALREGQTVPEGWVVTPEGKPITNPTQYFQEKGAILPLGGTPALGSYKGFGLSVAVELLCSILSGTLAIPQIVHEPDSAGRANHFFGALRINSFIHADNFRKGMDDMIRTYRNLPKASGVARIYMAGEIEQQLEEERLRNGIPLHPAVVASLQKLAEDMGVRFDL